MAMEENHNRLHSIHNELHNRHHTNLHDLVHNNVLINQEKFEEAKYTVDKKELTAYDQICMLLAETLGTGLLVFFGCMGCIDWFDMPGMHVAASLNFGLTVMFVVHIFGHISYAILNPAIVITAVIHKFIDIKLGVMYIIAEMIGSILGYGLLYAVTPQKHFETAPGSSGLCITNLHPSVSVAQGFFIEFFLVAVLVLVVCSVWDSRNKDKADSACIKIGLAVTALCLAGGPSTVASMNPARSIGPAIWNWEWDNHWMYWVSAMSSSLCTTLLYKIIFWKDPEQESSNS